MKRGEHVKVTSGRDLLFWDGLDSGRPTNAECRARRQYHSG